MKEYEGRQEINIKEDICLKQPAPESHEARQYNVNRINNVLTRETP